LDGKIIPQSLRDTVVRMKDEGGRMKARKEKRFIHR
jgi:hypothetical protein